LKGGQYEEDHPFIGAGNNADFAGCGPNEVSRSSTGSFGGTSTGNERSMRGACSTMALGRICDGSELRREHRRQ
jgi:hypothetical protein